nr:hypothetical protein [Tanacetum cinerariifolium]
MFSSSKKYPPWRVGPPFRDQTVSDVCEAGSDAITGMAGTAGQAGAAGHQWLRPHQFRNPSADSFIALVTNWVQSMLLMLTLRILRLARRLAAQEELEERPPDHQAHRPDQRGRPEPGYNLQAAATTASGPWVQSLPGDHGAVSKLCVFAVAVTVALHHCTREDAAGASAHRAHDLSEVRASAAHGNPVDVKDISSSCTKIQTQLSDDGVVPVISTSSQIPHVPFDDLGLPDRNVRVWDSAAPSASAANCHIRRASKSSAAYIWAWSLPIAASRLSVAATPSGEDRSRPVIAAARTSCASGRVRRVGCTGRSIARTGCRRNFRDKALDIKRAEVVIRVRDVDVEAAEESVNQQRLVSSFFGADVHARCGPQPGQRAIDAVEGAERGQHRETAPLAVGALGDDRVAKRISLFAAVVVDAHPGAVLGFPQIADKARLDHAHGCIAAGRSDRDRQLGARVLPRQVGDDDVGTHVQIAEKPIEDRLDVSHFEVDPLLVHNSSAGAVLHDDIHIPTAQFEQRQAVGKPDAEHVAERGRTSRQRPDNIVKRRPAVGRAHIHPDRRACSVQFRSHSPRPCCQPFKHPVHAGAYDSCANGISGAGSPGGIIVFLNRRTEHHQVRDDVWLYDLHASSLVSMALPPSVTRTNTPVRSLLRAAQAQPGRPNPQGSGCFAGCWLLRFLRLSEAKPTMPPRPPHSSAQLR